MKNLRISIIGDGLTGLVTALSMANLNLKVDIYCKNILNNNKKDNRVTAVSQSNLDFLNKEIKFSKKLFYQCKAMNLFHEFKSKQYNFLNYSDEDKNLVYIFENSKIRNFLIKRIKTKKNINIFDKNISLINSEKTEIKYNNVTKPYDLIILCLGKYSKLYENLVSERTIKKNTEEVAVTALVRHNKKIDSAMQYFLNEGPFAILPFKDNYFSVVWTLNKNFYKKNFSNIKKIIHNKINSFLKTKIEIKDFKSFPVNLDLKTKYFKKNTLVLGEGIHSIHPIAGQGFNLVLRDIKKLNDLIKEKLNLGLQIKNSSLLNDFYNLRKPENIILGLGVEMTNSFFKSSKLLDPIKNIALKNIGKNFFIKRFSQIVSDKGLIF
mgnify:FL=1